jgi:hypothetical protein
LEEDELEQALMHLFELGLVSVDYDEDLNPRFGITDVGREKLGQQLGDNTDDV